MKEKVNEMGSLYGTREKHESQRVGMAAHIVADMLAFNFSTHSFRLEVLSLVAKQMAALDEIEKRVEPRLTLGGGKRKGG